MRPRTFRLTEAEATELQEAFQHCHDARAKTRYQAVRLYGTGYRVEHILDVCACNRTSLLEWAHAYRQRGLSALLDHRQGDNRALLTAEQVEAVQTRLHRYTPAQLFGHDRCVGSGLFWTVAGCSGRFLTLPVCWNEITVSPIRAAHLTRHCCKSAA